MAFFPKTYNFLKKKFFGATFYLTAVAKSKQFPKCGNHLPKSIPAGRNPSFDVRTTYYWRRDLIISNWVVSGVVCDEGRLHASFRILKPYYCTLVTVCVAVVRRTEYSYTFAAVHDVIPILPSLILKSTFSSKVVCKCLIVTCIAYYICGYACERKLRWY